MRRIAFLLTAAATVTIAGPAACTVSQAGSGEVRCGHKAE